MSLAYNHFFLLSIDQKISNYNFKLYGENSNGISFWSSAITSGQGHFKRYHPLTKPNSECLDEQWRQCNYVENSSDWLGSMCESHRYTVELSLMINVITNNLIVPKSVSLPKRLFIAFSSHKFIQRGQFLCTYLYVCVQDYMI